MQTPDYQKDKEAVKKVVLEYVEGAYQADSERVKPIIHPDLAKVGYVWEDDHYAEYRMTRSELLETVKTYNADGHIPADAPKNTTIFEILDKTATIKLEAWWGIDYFHLVKLDGSWVIINVIWQTHPQSTNTK